MATVAGVLCCLGGWQLGSWVGQLLSWWFIARPMRERVRREAAIERMLSIPIDAEWTAEDIMRQEG